MRSIPFLLCALAVLGVLFSTAPAPGPRSADECDLTAAARTVAGADLPFVANEGQHEPGVAYSVSTPTFTVLVTRAGNLVYRLPGRTMTETCVGGEADPAPGTPLRTRVSVIRDDFPTVTNPVQPSHAGGVQDAYVAHLDASLAGGGKTRRFELVKGTVRLKSSGWKLELKKVYLDAGERGYAGTGSDITVIIDGVEYFPTADRIVKVGSSKITIKDALRGHKLTIKTSSWKTYLKLKNVPEGDMDPTDGLDIRMTLQGFQGDLTATLLPGSSKKLMPEVGTMVEP